MRAVIKDVNAAPSALSSADCIAHLELILADPEKKPSSSYYRGTTTMADGTVTNTVVDSLKDLYKNKCAYCEALSHDPEVEHYRPKGKVVGGHRGNRGYYWLAYEWTNLVPSCHDCNSIVRKGFRFPIQHARKATHPVIGNPARLDTASNLFNSQYLLSEGPLLVHPEYCADPFVHFDFDRDGGIMGLTDEGRETTAEYCN